MDGDTHWEAGRLYKESCFGANQAQWNQVVLYVTKPAQGRQEDSPLSAFLHLSQLQTFREFLENLAWHSRSAILSLLGGKKFWFVFALYQHMKF